MIDTGTILKIEEIISFRVETRSAFRFCLFFLSFFRSLLSPSLSILVSGRCLLTDSPFTVAYRYTLSHYYRNHSAARRAGSVAYIFTMCTNDSYYVLRPLQIIIISLSLSLFSTFCNFRLPRMTRLFLRVSDVALVTREKYLCPVFRAVISHERFLPNLFPANTSKTKLFSIYTYIM